MILDHCFAHMYGITEPIQCCQYAELETVAYSPPRHIRLLYLIRRVKWGWVGHVARQTNKRWTNISTFWYLAQHKRKLVKQKTRWHDQIIKYLGNNKLYHRVTWDRKEWDRLKEAFAQSKGEFLDWRMLIYIVLNFPELKKKKKKKV